MYKVLFALFILLALFFPKSEAFAICNYCPAGTERDDSCLLDNGTPQERAVQKTPGCAGTKVPNEGDPLSDSCQCVDPLTAAPAAPVAPTAPTDTAKQCTKKNVLTCPDGQSANQFTGLCIGRGGGINILSSSKPKWSCSDAGTEPSSQDDSCKCVSGDAATAIRATAAAAAALAVCAGDRCTGGKGLQCVPSTGKILEKGPGIMTAIGCIPSNPQDLIEAILKYGVLGAGGIAFLLMILGALQLITAEGNPESIKHGQERFYSAIIGLLFIIFSVLLLQVIGVDLLDLPGFGR